MVMGDVQRVSQATAEADRARVIQGGLNRMQQDIDAAAARMAKEFEGIMPILTAAMAPYFDSILSAGRNVADWWAGQRDSVLPHFQALPEEAQRRIDALERVYHAFRADGDLPC